MVHVVQVLCLVLDMSVVFWVRGVGAVCVMCICLTRDGVGGVLSEWMRGMRLGFTNHVGTVEVWDVRLCLVCCGVCCVLGWSGDGWWFGAGSWRVVLCMCLL